MPRQERTKSGTGIYHVMLRGINKQDIFEDDEDYLQMTSCLQGLTERYDENGVTVETVYHTDGELKEFLSNTHGVSNPLMVQSLEKNRRNYILKSMKDYGAGIRQLSRLTGVSYGVIQKL